MLIDKLKHKAAVEFMEGYVSELHGHNCTDFTLEFTAENISLYLQYLEWFELTQGEDPIDITKELQRSFNLSTVPINGKKDVIFVYGGIGMFAEFLLDYLIDLSENVTPKKGEKK